MKHSLQQAKKNNAPFAYLRQKKDLICNSNLKLLPDKLSIDFKSVHRKSCPSSVGVDLEVIPDPGIPEDPDLNSRMELLFEEYLKVEQGVPILDKVENHQKLGVINSRPLRSQHVLRSSKKQEIITSPREISKSKLQRTNSVQSFAVSGKDSNCNSKVPSQKFGTNGRIPTHEVTRFTRNRNSIAANKTISKSMVNLKSDADTSLKPKYEFRKQSKCIISPEQLKDEDLKEKYTRLFAEIDSALSRTIPRPRPFPHQLKPLSLKKTREVALVSKPSSVSLTSVSDHQLNSQNKFGLTFRVENNEHVNGLNAIDDSFKQTARKVENVSQNQDPVGKAKGVASRSRGTLRYNEASTIRFGRPSSCKSFPDLSKDVATKTREFKSISKIPVPKRHHSRKRLLSLV